MNKIIVSIVFAVILIIGINKITDIIFYVEKPKKSAYQVAGISTAASTQMSSESSDDVAMEDIITLLASSTAADGEKVFKKH